jgi:hypothetical protein
MTTIEEKTKAIVQSVEHPLETVKALEHEAEDGYSARTPAIALAGVVLVLAVPFVILMAVAMTLYFLYGGS